MKKIFLILFVLPFILFGQEQSPCYSVNDYNISILEQNPPLTIDLNEGWNMIGYPCVEPMQVEGALISIVDELLILKDNYGDVYWPEYGFNGIGSLKQLNGYQINLLESVENFSFCSTVELTERNGCTDCEAFNFDIWATLDDGSCLDVLEGCTDALAFNFNELANTEDGSCIAFVFGCTDAMAFNYNLEANTEFDPTNCEAFVLGCMDSTAYNYNTDANTDDDSCEDVVEGCIDQTAYTYNPTANTDNGSCVFYNSQTSQFNGGCDFENYPLAYEGNTGANMTVMLLPEFINSLNVANENAYLVALNQNGLVIGSLNLFDVSQASFPIWGDDTETTVVDGALNNESLRFQLVDGSSLWDISMPIEVTFTYNAISVQADLAVKNLNQECTTYACPYDVYLEYIPYASVYDIEYCVNLIVEGCTNQMYLEYITEANVDNGSCATLIVQGCIDPNYFEFNPEANVEDGSCEILIVQGCTNPFAINYNQNANFDDGNCELLGCMELYADNYNPEATLNDDSCIYYGCLNPTADNFDPSANTNDSTCIIYGCALSVFPNYNSQATIDDGSCDMSSTDVFGCANSLALNYNPEVTSANGSCEFDPSIIFGCTNTLALNYNPNATNDNGSCEIISVSDFDFEPVPSDNNMSVVFPEGTLNDFIGGFLKAFKADGTPVSSSSEIAEDGSAGIAAIGTDAICGCDYLSGGDQLIFAILMDDLTIVNVDVNPPITYVPNTFEMVSGNLSFSYNGCTNPLAVNYNPNITIDNGNCNIIDVSVFDFEPVPTDNTMSVVFPAGTLNDFAGGSLMALKANGTLVSAASEIAVDGSGGIAAIGTDNGCACDYLSNGDQLIFAILMDDQTIVHVDVNPPLTYAPNTFEMLSGSLEFTIDGAPEVFGCTDSEAFNYNELATIDNGSCDFSIHVGVLVEGGIVFYVDETGEHGLVAASENMEGTYEFGCYQENVIGADGTAIGTGYQNTMDIVNQGCVTENGGITAGQAALDAGINGFSDWYLPSKDELNEMYSTIGNGGPEGNIGGFQNGWYWSSSEYDSNNSFGVSFGNGLAGYSVKNGDKRVRVIRAF